MSVGTVFFLNWTSTLEANFFQLFRLEESDYSEIIRELTKVSVVSDVLTFFMCKELLRTRIILARS
jgi:hypothetical protein